MSIYIDVQICIYTFYTSTHAHLLLLHRPVLQVMWETAASSHDSGKRSASDFSEGLPAKINWINL